MIDIGKEFRTELHPFITGSKGLENQTMFAWVRQTGRIILSILTHFLLSDENASKL